jgi:hypothetical protein
MLMTLLSRLTLASIVAAGAALSAQDAHFGVQGQVNIPLGDLKDFVDSKPGLGVGVHGTFDLGSGSVIRPRFDYNVYPKATVHSLDNKADNVNLGADYLYYVDGKSTEGFYLTGGLSAVRWHFDTNGFTEDTTRLGVALGGGYQWNSTFGTELRYTTSKVDGNTVDAIQVGATIRF